MSDYQFRFMPERSTVEVIHLLRRLIERYCDTKNDLHIILIDLEKAYDRVSREVMWRVLEKIGIRIAYIESIKKMYEDVVTSVRIPGRLTREFPINIDLH
ncbi:hypothetical protein ACH5RR_036021 [Cinchona calisaya]|uniref:Reverse transcriptase domain-containing protein n=1 Tax=Cinchona calisaya TaxID=153742 RepID=A0ABD2Y6R3_9GENT